MNRLRHVRKLVMRYGILNLDLFLLLILAATSEYPPPQIWSIILVLIGCRSIWIGFDMYENSSDVDETEINCRQKFEEFLFIVNEARWFLTKKALDPGYRALNENPRFIAWCRDMQMDEDLARKTEDNTRRRYAELTDANITSPPSNAELIHWAEILQDQLIHSCKDQAEVGSAVFWRFIFTSEALASLIDRLYDLKTGESVNNHTLLDDVSKGIMHELIKLWKMNLMYDDALLTILPYHVRPEALRDALDDDMEEILSSTDSWAEHLISYVFPDIDRRALRERIVSEKRPQS